MTADEWLSLPASDRGGGRSIICRSRSGCHPGSNAAFERCCRAMSYASISGDASKWRTARARSQSTARISRCCTGGAHSWATMRRFSPWWSGNTIASAAGNSISCLTTSRWTGAPSRLRSSAGRRLQSVRVTSAGAEAWFRGVLSGDHREFPLFHLP